jgi:hypothetical protein
MTYQDAIAAADEYTKRRADGVRGVYYAETNVRAPREGEGAWEYVRKLISAPFMGAINQMTQEIAGSNLNHMSQMKSFGDKRWADTEQQGTAGRLASPHFQITARGRIQCKRHSSTVLTSKDNSRRSEINKKVGFLDGATWHHRSS